MGQKFKEEIAYIPEAIEWATSQDVTLLKRAILSISSRNLFAIGSGGSFTIATYAASCHEKRFGQMSRAVTPLEYCIAGAQIQQAASLLLSAEGKNKDILAAARSTLVFEHPCVALTLKNDTPLTAFAIQSGAMSTPVFEMPWNKDGYLATNSLIAMTILVAKAYFKESDVKISTLDFITAEWISERRQLISTVITEYKVGTQVLVLYSNISYPSAVDLESKFAEATLGTCQLADYRQFAHGRHLQLESAKNAIVIAFLSNDDEALATATLALLPQNVRQLVLTVPKEHDIAVVQGIIDAMLITDVASDLLNIDPGQPDVPEFCRAIHHLDMRSHIEEKLPPVAVPIYRKLKRDGNNVRALHRLSEAAETYIKKVSDANIKALVCDFDGTFCETDKRYEGLDGLLVEDIERIAHHNVPIVFATGRGDSLYDDLRKKIDARYWQNIYIGYYSGSYIAALTQKPDFPPKDPRFEELLSWLDHMGLHARIETEPKMDCGQMGLRCGNHAFRHEAVTAIELYIKEQQLTGWRVYCSGHSIDVLSDRAGKRKVVDFVEKQFSIDRHSEIIRLGDSGDFDGNDYELLSEGLSLSVNAVSSNPLNCWNFLPLDQRGVVGTKYYLRHMQFNADNKNSISMASLYDSYQGKE